MRGFVEHKQMSARPTYLGEDGKLHATEETGAPTTLVRMIVLGSPMSEKDDRAEHPHADGLRLRSCRSLTSALTWLV